MREFGSSTSLRKKTWRGVLLGAAIVVAAIGLTACGGGSSSGGSTSGGSTSDESASSNESTTITWVTEEDLPVKEKAYMVKKFEEAYPNIHVKMRMYPFTQLLTVTPTILGAGEPFDVATADSPEVIDYYVHGWLAPLDEFFPQSVREEYLPRVFEAGEYDEHLVAVPRESSSQLLYINEDLFKEAGVKPPPGLKEGTTEAAAEGRWTWEQVVEAAKKIKEKTGAWGFAFEQVDTPYQLLPLGESLGRGALSPDGLSADGYLNSPQWIKAATWYGNTYNKWKISPPGLGSEGTYPAFFSGKIAMLVAGPWWQEECEKAEFNCNAGSQPYFEGGKVVTPTGSLDLAIPAASEHKEAAATFIKWFSLEANHLWTEKTGNVPATKEGAESIRTNPEYLKWPKDIQRLSVEESENTASARPRTPGYQEFSNVFTQAFGSIRAGEDPTSTLESATEEIDSLLSRYK